MLMGWHSERGDTVGDCQRFCNLDKGMSPCPELGANRGDDRRPGSLELGKRYIGRRKIRFLPFGGRWRSRGLRRRGLFLGVLRRAPLPGFAGTPPERGRNGLRRRGLWL
jgi:hypothetical protein